MAYTIHEQPSEAAFSKSPILYLVSDTLYAEDKFQYLAQVFLWQGLIGDKPATANYNLYKPSNASTGAATFDIRTLLSDFFISPQYQWSGDNDTQDMYVWVSIEFGYTYVDGAGATIDRYNEATSDTIIALNGYNYYNEGINYKSDTHLLNPYFMTDKPTEINIPLNTKMRMFLLPNISASAGPVAQIITNVNEGDHIFTIDLTVATSEMITVRSGTYEIEDMAKEEPYYYEIYGADAVGTPVTETYKFTVVEPCKYGFRNLQFMNRYGVWDNILLYGKETESLDVERSDIINSPLSVSAANAFVFTEQLGQYHMNNIHSRESLNVNTGWISEEWNAVIKQLMITDELYDPDTLEPFILDSKSLTYKSSLNDGLINYTMKLKYAHSAINLIG